MCETKYSKNYFSYYILSFSIDLYSFDQLFFKWISICILFKSEKVRNQ